jgi:anti-anti-sigma factor
VACLPSYTVVTLAGELDLDNREQLRATFDTLLNEGRYRIVVDMTGLTFCDSTGLGILVAARKRAEAHGGWVRLTTPTAHVYRLFNATGMIRLFSFHRSVDEAVADVAGSTASA